jgi:predicted outer membrane repeat protein
MRIFIFSIFFFTLHANLPAQPHHYYVKTTVTGTQTGLSWNDAFPDLQTALQIAQYGDTLWVASGTYSPTSTTDRTISFNLPSGILLYGGFAGTETTLGQQDWLTNKTILSGDIGIPNDSTDNTFNIMYADKPDQNTLINGFVFRYGNANNPDNQLTSLDRTKCGGALYIMGQDGTAYPTIINCKFEFNTALKYGGAVCTNGSGTGSVAPLFRHCTFDHNHAGGNGGGLARLGGSWIERGVDWMDCTFSDNRADQSGGGLYASDSERNDTFDLSHCNFFRNSSGYKGFAAYFAEGRYSTGSTLKIIGSRFEENSGISDHGSVLEISTYAFGYLNNIVIDSCNIINNHIFKQSNVELTAVVVVNGIGNDANLLHTKSEFKNCILSENSCTSGSLCIWEHDYVKKINFDNITFLKNTDLDDLLFLTGVNTAILNKVKILHNTTSNIYFFNIEDLRLENILSANNDAGQSADFVFSNCSATILNSTISNKNYTAKINRNNSNINIFNSIFSHSENHLGSTNNQSMLSIANSFLSNFNCNSLPPGIACGPGLIIGSDPMFRDTTIDDYSLLPCSPLVNAGDNSVTTDLATDLAGNPRIQGGRVDIGAYEAPIPGLAGTPVVSPACEGIANGSATLQIQGGCGPYQITWTFGPSTGQGLTDLFAGNYILTITDIHGASFTSNLTIPLGSPITLTPSSSPVICGDTIGGSATVHANGGLSPYSFHWQGSSDSIYSNLTPGNYPITVTDAIGCTSTIFVPVSKTGSLSISVQTMPISCYGAADGSFTIAPQNGKSPYQWNWENGPSSPAYGPLGPGTYNGTLTDAFGCSIIWVLPLSQPDSISFQAIITPATDSMPGNGGIQLNPIFGGTQPYSAFWSNGQNFLALHNLMPGTYSVTLTDHNGCTKTASYLVPFTVGTYEAEAGLTISIYPNPADQVVHIRSKNDLGPCTVFVIDAIGRKIWEDQVSDLNVDLNVGMLPAGLYQFSATTENTKRAVSKFLVQH